MPALLSFVITLVPYLFSAHLMVKNHPLESIPLEKISLAGSIVSVCSILNTIAVFVSVYRWAKCSEYKKLTAFIISFVAAAVIVVISSYALFMISIESIRF